MNRRSSSHRPTLEQRVERLENILKRKRVSLKLETGSVDRNHLRKDQALLRALLVHKDVNPIDVRCEDGEIVVTLDWDSYGYIDFYIEPTGTGYHVYAPEQGDESDVGSLDEAARFIADENMRALDEIDRKPWLD